MLLGTIQVLLQVPVVRYWCNEVKRYLQYPFLDTVPRQPTRKSPRSFIILKNCYQIQLAIIETNSKLHAADQWFLLLSKGGVTPPLLLLNWKYLQNSSIILRIMLFKNILKKCLQIISLILQLLQLLPSKEVECMQEYTAQCSALFSLL